MDIMKYKISWPKGDGAVTVDGEQALMAAITAAVVNGKDTVTVSLVLPPYSVTWSGFCESHQKGFYDLDEAYAFAEKTIGTDAWASVKVTGPMGTENGKV